MSRPSSSVSSSLLPFFPPPSKRRWISVFVALFLVGHLSIPLAYYVFPSSPSDERFRWRMFSGRRMMSCRVSVTAQKEQPNGTSYPETIALQRHFQYSWVNLLQQGRPAVIERSLAHLCKTPKMSEVSLERRCQGVGPIEPGQPPPQTSTEVRLLCASQRLTWQGDR